jgi:hypothetical protein
LSSSYRPTLVGELATSAGLRLFSLRSRAPSGCSVTRSTTRWLWGLAGSALRVQLGSFASSLTRLEYTQRLDNESLSRSIVSAHQEATTD